MSAKKKDTSSTETTVIKPEETPKIDRVAIVSQFKRDSFGLLENVDYHFNSDGTVNWRKMVKKEYLVPNKDKFDSSVDTKALNPLELEDSQLLILLGGIKDLALIRGYSGVNYDVVASAVDYVSVKCTIKWIPNYENAGTNIGEPIIFSSLADAHLNNTYNFASNFLMAIAENRAFVRAVRNFLRINIVGQDEMGGKKGAAFEPDTKDEPSITDPINALNKAMAGVGLTFELIKTKLIGEGEEEASKWDSVSDIPKKRIYSLIDRIKNKNKKS